MVPVGGRQAAARLAVRVGGGRQGRSLRGLLWLTCACAVLPILAMVAYLLVVSTLAQWDRMESAATDVARSVASAVDRDLDASARSLRALASAAGGDPASAPFREAMERLARREGVDLDLSDPEGRTVLTTRAAGGPPPSVAGDGEASGVFGDGGSTRYAVAVPLPVADGRAFRLTASVPADRLAELLSKSAAPPGWFVTVVDADGRIVARNERHGELVGRQASRDFLATPREGAGIWSGRTLEEQEVRGAYANVGRSGWRVAVGADAADFEAPAWRSLGLFLGLAMVACGLSVALGWLQGRRLTRALDSLSSGARTVGRGGIHLPAGTGVREIDAVADTLATASLSLRERDREIARGEVRFQEIASAIDDVFLVYDPRTGAVLYASPSFERVWGRAAEAILGDPAGWEAGMHPDDRHASLRRSDQAGREARYRIVRPDGSVRWVRERVFAAGDGSGHRMVAVCVDVTGDVAAEERQSLMMRELHHRVKNTLATVLSVSRQTARSSRDLAAFEESFGERIRSLARTHTLLTGRDWESICLRDLVEGEVAPYAPGAGGDARVEGPALPLPSETGFALGMAIHELATNAAKHGAWSRPGGRVSVIWEASAEGMVRLTWEEAGGPPVTRPGRGGFGSQLLARVLGGQLGATFETRYEPDGLRFEAEFQVPRQAGLGGRAPA